MLSEEDTSLENSSVKIPSWVIYFVVLLFVISVFGFIYFHRFSKSVHYYKLSIKTFQENDLEAAEKYITSASDLVPDNKEILSFKYYVSGIKNYTEDNYDEALEFLKKYQSYNSDDSFIGQLILSIEISRAFDEKDYSQMVKYAAQLYSDYNTGPLVILQYASALACEYVATENIDDYNKAMELIESARTYELDDYNLDYIKRIEYRLTSKKIISNDEYHQLEKEGKL